METWSWWEPQPQCRLAVERDITEGPKCKYVCAGTQEKSHTSNCIETVSEGGSFSELKHLQFDRGTSGILSGIASAGDCHCLHFPQTLTA